MQGGWIKINGKDYTGTERMRGLRGRACSCLVREGFVNVELIGIPFHPCRNYPFLFTLLLLKVKNSLV